MKLNKIYGLKTILFLLVALQTMVTQKTYAVDTCDQMESQIQIALKNFANYCRSSDQSICDKKEINAALRLSVSCDADLDLIKKLITTGAEMQNFVQGELPIITLAVRHTSHPEVIQMFLAMGATLDIDYNPYYQSEPGRPFRMSKDDRDSGILSITSLAVRENANLAVVKFLISAVAKPLSATQYLLIASASNTNPEITKYFKQMGGDIENPSQYQVTDLMIAAQSNPNPEVLRGMIQLGAKADARDSSEGTVLIYAARSHLGLSPDTIKMFSSQLNATNRCNWTALMATSYGYDGTVEAVEALVKAGADLNVKSSPDRSCSGYGSMTALDFANASGTYEGKEKTAILLRAGARSARE